MLRLVCKIAGSIVLWSFYWLKRKIVLYNAAVHMLWEAGGMWIPADAVQAIIINYNHHLFISHNEQNLGK